MSTSRTRRRISTSVTIAVICLGLGAGTAQAAPGPGAPRALDHPKGISPGFVTAWAGCKFVTSVPSVGGAQGPGFSNLWLIKVDNQTTNNACHFVGRVANDVQSAAPGAPSRIVNFAGGNDGTVRQSYGASEQEKALHPYAITMRVCNGTNCSGDING